MMTINEASIFLENLKAETNKYSEIKVYTSFIEILSDLQNKKLAKGQLKSIEKKLDELKLDANVENRKKYLNQKLGELIKYLNDDFFLITKGYYSALSISLGVLFGIGLGIVFEKSIGISFGISIGLITGQAIGSQMDAEAEKENRVLNSNLSN